MADEERKSHSKGQPRPEGLRTSSAIDVTTGLRHSEDEEPGSTRVSMIEVAELAGVAISSVSRVLSGHPDVSRRMKARVLMAVEQLGYQPDFLAQSLRRGATLSVGFISRDISTPLNSSFASGAEHALRNEHYSMVLMNSDGEADLDAQHIRFFQSRRVDGMILSLTSENEPSTLEVLAKLTVPAVVIDRELPAHLGIIAVQSDHRAGLKAATSYLTQLGHRRIGLVSGPMNVMPSRERLAGVRDALRDAGIKEDVLIHEGSFSPNDGRGATEGLLDLQDPPTAIIAGSNSLLIGCLRAFRARHLEIGKDVSLVSCDDVPLSELMEPPIAVVARDSLEVGRVAAELLLRRIRGEQVASPVVLPTHFVARPSCVALRRD